MTSVPEDEIAKRRLPGHEAAPAVGIAGEATATEEVPWIR